MSSVLILDGSRSGWLRGVNFDSTYIVGIASLAVALVSFYLVERPLLRLKKRFA